MRGTPASSSYSYIRDQTSSGPQEGVNSFLRENRALILHDGRRWRRLVRFSCLRERDGHEIHYENRKDRNRQP